MNWQPQDIVMLCLMVPMGLLITAYAVMILIIAFKGD